MIFGFGKQICKMCDNVKKPDEEFSTLRLQTHEGLVELEICTECADFFDKSADVLRKKNVKDEPI
jgi:hypothetical protein